MMPYHDEMRQVHNLLLASMNGELTPFLRSMLNALLWKHFVTPHRSYIVSCTYAVFMDAVKGERYRIGYRPFGCQRSRWRDPTDYLSWSEASLEDLRDCAEKLGVAVDVSGNPAACWLTIVQEQMRRQNISPD